MNFNPSGPFYICKTIIGEYLIYKLEKYYYAQVKLFDGGEIICSNLTFDECVLKCKNHYENRIFGAYYKIVEATRK